MRKHHCLSSLTISQILHEWNAVEPVEDVLIECWECGKVEHVSCHYNCPLWTLSAFTKHEWSVSSDAAADIICSIFRSKIPPLLLQMICLLHLHLAFSSK